MLYDKRWEPKLPAETIEPWRQCLLDAADLLKREGWRTNSMGALGEPKCVLGAIRYSGHSNEVRIRAEEIFQHHVGMPLAEWNDCEVTFGWSVRRALRKAARQ